MFKNDSKRRPWPLPTLCSLVLTATLLMVSSGSASRARPQQQAEPAIEAVGHFGGTIGALALPSESGDHLYVGEGSGFTVVDVSDESRPRQVGSLPLPGSEVTDVVLSGSVAYVTNGDGLQIIDLSEPVTPTLLSSLDSPGFARTVVVSDSHAYVADDGEGLWIVDVSDPADPQEAGS